MTTATYYAAHANQIKSDAKERMAILRSTPEGRAILAARARKYMANLRLRVIKALGGHCLCGIDDVMVLQIDHRFGGGLRERKQYTNKQLYLKILRNPLPYQVLCANCNWRKRRDFEQRSPTTERLRQQAIVMFGGCCVGCLNIDSEVLQFDHINDDGFKTRTHRVMARLYKEYLAGRHEVQLLCANCHQRKAQS